MIMDDDLEPPTSSAPVVATENADEADQSSDEDDGGPDWTKLPSNSLNKPIIPKRGDKEFEPSGEHGTNLQQHKLDRIRTAMFSALDVERTVSSKTASYAVWVPAISRAYVTNARGNHLITMGHHVPREAPTKDKSADSNVREEERLWKRVELLPEEALYVIERGSMFCWKQDAGRLIEHGMEELQGTPMTVQQAYAEMIGKEDMTLERYQVFSYLKRLGYVVIRARAPDSFYITPPPFQKFVKSTGRLRSIFGRIGDVFLAPFRYLFIAKMDWWKPLRISKLLHRYLSYSSIFTALRFISTGHDLPLYHPPYTVASSQTSVVESPYEIFYNLYKPSTPFRKTAPPPPDFSVVVINGRTTPMPTLDELTALFDHLPELPPPVPRKRINPTAMRQRRDEQFSQQSMALLPPITATVPPSLSSRVTAIFSRASTAKDPPVRKPNPFQILKAGKKIVVVAVVDAGMISFFRFGQGAFEDWPMT